MNAGSFAEYYPYHGNLGPIPWMCTTNEDERYLDERVHNLEQRRIYRDHERKNVDWKATYAWIEKGMRELPPPPLPYVEYLLDTKKDPAHPRIRKVKNAQPQPLPAASQEKPKGGNGWRRRRYFAFGQSKNH